MTTAPRITPQIDFRAELGPLFELAGKVAYLPGGYGGLGEAIAWGLALRGARMPISGRDAGKAEALAAMLRDGGHEASGLVMVVTRVPDIRRSVDTVVERFGTADILVNCVGIQIEQKLTGVTEEAFDGVY